MLNLNTLKQEIFVEHNKIRKNPKSYIPIVEKYLTYFKDGVLYNPGENVGISSPEGPSAYEKCIKFLKTQNPVKELQLNALLSNSAQDHANDIGPKGLTDHVGSDGSQPSDRIEKYLNWELSLAENLDFGGKTGEEIIVSLIVDDGVPSRGHRTNIFKADSSYVGIGLSKHNSEFEVCTVIAYVGDILDEKVKSKKEPSLETIKVKMQTTKSTSPSKKEEKDVQKTQKRDPKKSKGPKKENYFSPPMELLYDFNRDEDKPKNAVDVKVKTTIRKVNGEVFKNTTRTYKIKDGSEVVLEIEESTRTTR